LHALNTLRMPLLKTLEENGLLTLTISRPDALNALNAEMLDGLREYMQEIYQNVKIRGVILTGEGEKAFVAGADIKELFSLNEEESLKFVKSSIAQSRFLPQSMVLRWEEDVN